MLLQIYTPILPELVVMLWWRDQTLLSCPK
jgi:hypothetical protein